MAIISSYPVVQPSAGDYLVGTKVTNTGTQINPTKNFTVESVGDLLLGYQKVYTALVQQLGGAPPSNVELLRNTTGTTLFWVYVSTGRYRLVANDPIFTNNKTLVFLNVGGKGDVFGFVSWERNSDTEINVVTRDETGALANDILNHASFEVRIYS